MTRIVITTVAQLLGCVLVLFCYYYYNFFYRVLQRKTLVRNKNTFEIKSNKKKKKEKKEIKRKNK